MLDEILVKLGLGSIHRVCMITNIVSQIVKAFEADYAQDGNAKNTAIDAVVVLLQKQKDIAATIEPKA